MSRATEIADNIGRHWIGTPPAWCVDVIAELVRLDGENAALRETLMRPQLVAYDPMADVLTINGRKYAHKLFGPNGFVAPAGTLLRIEEGPDDVVTCSDVQPEIEAIWMDSKRLALELECLLMSCDLPAASKWWDSSNEALELHRQLVKERQEQS